MISDDESTHKWMKYTTCIFNKLEGWLVNAKNKLDRRQMHPVERKTEVWGGGAQTPHTAT